MGIAELPNYPELNEIEVSLFGGGNAFGESILIHAGNNFWILIDCNINLKTKQPFALEYLQKITNTSEDKIKVIVATHWHDDHIRGISDALSQSNNDTCFVLSYALTSDEFQLLTGYESSINSFNSGIREFKSIFEILQQRGSKAKFSLQDRTLFSIPDCQLPIEIISLSPSDSSVVDSLKFFRDQTEKQNQNPNFVAVKQSQNDHSVVLLVNIGETSLLFGADLEVVNDETKGWDAVLSSELAKKGKSIVFKVPHHGSNNAFHDKVFSDMLLKDVYAILSPWKIGRNYLPKQEDKIRLLLKTPNTFITSGIPGTKIKKRDKRVYKITAELDINVVSAAVEFGHVRLRKKYGSQDWNVELFGNAIHLKDLEYDQL